jgi:hypothetical protein
MSIIKSTNSGKNLLWHVQAKKISHDIFVGVKDFPSNIWALAVKYKVPVIIFNDENKFVKTYKKHKIRFFRDIVSEDKIYEILIKSFEENLNTIIDGFTVEDIDLNRVEFEIEK